MFADVAGVRPTKILLLDGYSTRSLACVRSWGSRRIPFAVGGETGHDMSLLSRYATDTFVYTSPRRDIARFIADVNHYAQAFHADVVFPTSEAAIIACSKHRNELVSVPLIPTPQEIDTVFNKRHTLQVAQAILQEAALSFLGVGTGSAYPTWGQMIALGRDYINVAWWLSTFPGIAILLTVLAINLLGDRVRDLLDPRMT